MFRFDEGLKVYLHRPAIDFRMGINGLALMVEQALGMSPFATAVFVFSNRRRNRVKILGWDRTGFWLLLKRLEQDRFIWPDEATVPTLTAEQLHWLLDGIDVAVAQRHPHRFYERVGQSLIYRYTNLEAGLTTHAYWTSNCQQCAIRAQCTKLSYRRVRRWEHENVIDAMQRRLDREPERMRRRRQTVEHPFGTIKHWMGSTHFLTKTIGRVCTEMSLHVLACNLKRVMSVLGVAEAMKAMQLARA